MDFSLLYDLTALEVFRIAAPEFDGVNDTDVQRRMLFASAFVCKEEYGDAYNVALALMTAHIMALPGGVNGGYSTSAGRVTSMKEGDLSIGYGTLSGDDSWLGQSTYGGMLSMLRARIGLNIAFMTRGPIGGLAADDWKHQ